MLTINSKQVFAFSKGQEKNFFDRMVHHIRHFFPQVVAGKNDDLLRKELINGAEKAKSYNITSSSDLCRFFNLMYVFGINFDEDDNLPWAQEILNDSSYQSGSTKMMILHQMALEKLKDNQS